jgi:hypothetical protein
MDKLKEVVSKNGLYIKVGALVVALIGVFLEFAKVTATYSFWGVTQSYKAGIKFSECGDGKAVIILIIVAAVLLLAEKFAKDLYDKIPQQFAPYGPMGLSVVALGLTIYDAIDAKSKFKGLSSYGDVKLTLEIGFWITLIGLVVAVAVMVFEKFFMNKGAAATPAPAQPTETPVQPQ